MSPTIGSTAGGAVPSRPPWWMLVLAALFIDYYVLLLSSDLTRPEPVGFVLGINESAIVVRAVAPASPAARAGLEVGDRVLTANSHPVQSRLDWLSVEMNLRIDQPLRLEVERDDGRHAVLLVLQRAPWSLTPRRTEVGPFPRPKQSCSKPSTDPTSPSCSKVL